MLANHIVSLADRTLLSVITSTSRMSSGDFNDVMLYIQEDYFSV